MEVRAGRGGRGAQWRRGGAAGESDSGTGERRGRGRGGHHRGRGKRDHYRGRGRAHGSDGAADLFRRGHDEQDDQEKDEDEMPGIFSRRKLESNWDRYEESEKEEATDDVPTQRGTDYHVLLSSAGDSFTQFRFSEEKDWQMDSLATNQVPALFVDLEALAQTLQGLDLHTRLDLEPELVQDSIPVELPLPRPPHKVDPKSFSGFKPSVQAERVASMGERPVNTVSGTVTSSITSFTSPADEADKELDLLLALQKPIPGLSIAETKSTNAKEEASVQQTEEPQDPEVQLEAKETDINQHKAEVSLQPAGAVKQEMTEEDLEDWLDSMIS